MRKVWCSDWEGKGPCAIVPLTWKMAHTSLCRMIRNGPLKISKSLKKAENGPFDKNLFPITVGAVIIVDFYIDNYVFALFIFMKDGKAVNYNGSEIIGLIHLKYGKRTACQDNFLPWLREAGKRSTTGYKSQPVYMWLENDRCVIKIIGIHCACQISMFYN